MKRLGRIVLHGYTAIILASLAVLAGPSDGWSRPIRCAAVTPSQIANLFVRWNAALRTLDPDKVVENYAPNAILLPTVENGPLIGRDAIRGYFVHFLEKHPDGAIDSRTIRIGCNIAFDTGLYTFTLDGDRSGTRVPVRARYTYIYQINDGHWLIAHHHSSAQPK